MPQQPSSARSSPAQAQPAPPSAVAGPRPSPLAPYFLWGSIAFGLACLGYGIVATSNASSSTLPLLLALALVAEFLTVPFFESGTQRMSLSFTAAVVMATVAVAPEVAPVVATSAALVHVVQLRQWRRGWSRVLFNLANPALATAAAVGCAYLTGIARGGWFALLAITCATLVYHLANVGIIAINIAAHTGQPLRRIVRDALWSAPLTITIGLIGGFVGVANAQLGLLGMAIFALPLLVLRYALAYAAGKNREAIATLEEAHRKTEQSHNEKAQTLQEMITTVAAIIDARDKAVAGHSNRVAKYARAIGEELGVQADQLDEIYQAGLLHDLGKIAIPEAILHKPAKLTPEEYTLVKEHAATGERLLARVQEFATVAQMVGEHHERFDGRGYPDGKRGQETSLGGRILAVADTLDTILSDRPYSPGKPLAWALEEADRCAGSHFDPTVVAALQRLVTKRGTSFFDTVATPPPVPDTVADPLSLLIPIFDLPTEAKTAITL